MSPSVYVRTYIGDKADQHEGTHTVYSTHLLTFVGGSAVEGGPTADL